MRNVATSSMQGICAVLLLSSAGIANAQSAGGTLRAELRDSVARILAKGVADRAFPGAYAVVGTSRGVLTEASAGHLDWAPSARPSSHTLWDLASLTKVIGTTTALAQLVERGAVALDAPVQRYLPEWIGAGKESVTVKQLLTHSSGLPSFKPYDRQTHDKDSIATLLFETPLEYATGTKMVYSDIGAFIMGRIVERVSRETLDRYLARHVFAPLAMTETRFNPPRTMRSRIAPTEFDSTRGGLMWGKVHDERAYYLGGIAAHAGLFSSAHDVARFARMMLRGGSLDGNRILKAETIAQFTAYADSSFSNRALGWQKAPVSWAGRLMSNRAFGHTGFTGTSIAVDPELDVFIILLSNRVNPTRDNPRITDVRSSLADAVVSTVRRSRGLTINTGHP